MESEKTLKQRNEKKIINTENKLVVTKEIEGWRVSKMGKRSIVCCCFLTEKFLSVPGLSSYVFSVMVSLFHWLFFFPPTGYFAVVLTFDSLLSHDLPQGKVVFICTFSSLQLLTLGSSDIHLGYAP